MFVHWDWKKDMVGREVELDDTSAAIYPIPLQRSQSFAGCHVICPNIGVAIRKDKHFRPHMPDWVMRRRQLWNLDCARRDNEGFHINEFMT